MRSQASLGPTNPLPTLSDECELKEQKSIPSIRGAKIADGALYPPPKKVKKAIVLSEPMLSKSFIQKWKRREPEPIWGTHLSRRRLWCRKVATCPRWRPAVQRPTPRQHVWTKHYCVAKALQATDHARTRPATGGHYSLQTSL